MTALPWLVAPAHLGGVLHCVGDITWHRLDDGTWAADWTALCGRPRPVVAVARTSPAFPLPHWDAQPAPVCRWCQTRLANTINHLTATADALAQLDHRQDRTP